MNLFEDKLLQIPCHICHHQGLITIDGFTDFFRVTSDCQPWPSGGKLAVCRFCNAVPKKIERQVYRSVALKTGWAIFMPFLYSIAQRIAEKVRKHNGIFDLPSTYDELGEDVIR